MTTDHFNNAFVATVGVEGDYSNNPRDRGGETKYGITVAVARANGYAGPMRDMPLLIAQRIYRAQYWDMLRLDTVAGLAPRVAAELFDTGVNCGIATAGKFLQRALNALRAGSNLAVDGLIGPLTTRVLADYMLERATQGAETVLLRALNAQQAVHYIELTEMIEPDHEFVYGWLLKRVVI